MAKKEKSSQKIKCNVHNCDYNNCDNNLCNLEEIKVSCSDESSTEKKETICDSFKCSCECHEHEKE